METGFFFQGLKEPALLLDHSFELDILNRQFLNFFLKLLDVPLQLLFFSFIASLGCIDSVEVFGDSAASLFGRE